MRPYRRVKCGKGEKYNKTTDCNNNDRKSPAKCAPCFCDHPANYKPYQVYKIILERKINSKKTSLRASHIKSDTQSVKSAPEVNKTNA